MTAAAAAAAWPSSRSRWSHAPGRTLQRRPEPAGERLRSALDGCFPDNQIVLAEGKALAVVFVEHAYGDGVAAGVGENAGKTDVDHRASPDVPFHGGAADALVARRGDLDCVATERTRDGAGCRERHHCRAA